VNEKVKKGEIGVNRKNKSKKDRNKGERRNKREKGA
jgi:hypothetical protein